MISTGSDDANWASTGQYERTGPGVGAAPVQWAYGVRIDARPRFGAAQPVRVDGSIDRLGGSFGAARSLMVRAGAEVDLPFRTNVRMGAERNPYVVPAPGERLDLRRRCLARCHAAAAAPPAARAASCTAT